jgi:hypothetical protein
MKPGKLDQPRTDRSANQGEPEPAVPAPGQGREWGEREPDRQPHGGAARGDQMREAVHTAAAIAEQTVAWGSRADR